MSHSSDPRPLLEQSDVSPNLRQVLTQAQADIADEQQMKRLGLALAPLFNLPPGAELPPDLSSASTGAPHVGASSQSGTMTAVGASKTTALTGAKAAGSWLSAKAVTGAVVLAVGAATTWYAVSPGEESLQLPQEPPAQPSDIVQQEIPKAAEPAQVDEVPVQKLEQPPVEEPELATKKAPSKPLVPKAKSSNESASKANELKLLQRARALTVSDPQMALKLLAQHERQFPKSALAQEREVMRIRALDKLGRRQEAEQNSERFEKRFPDSAHRRTLETR